MAYVLFQEDNNPAMRYEGLARYAFDCDAWGGPNKIAHQSTYKSLFMPSLSSKGVNVISQILDALIKKTENVRKMQEFEDLQISLKQGNSQRNSIELINYIIQIIND